MSNSFYQWVLLGINMVNADHPSAILCDNYCSHHRSIMGQRWFSWSNPVAPAAVLLINKVQPTSTNLFTFVALCCAFTSPSWRHPCRHWRRRSGSVPAYSLFARRDCAGHCHMTRLTSAPPNHHGRTCHSRLRRSFIVTQAYQITMPFISENSLLQPTEEEDQARSIWQFRELVSWSLMSLFGTNVAISDTKGQGWKAIPTQWRKASDILT